MRSIEVFASGVAIWDGRRQFTLDDEQVGSLLAAVEAAGFVTFEAVYGGATSRQGNPKRPATEAVVTVTCRVSLRLSDVEKQSAQLEKGEQSEALRSLAETLFALCEGPARHGVAAADLADGLDLLARGRLAPETFSVVFHRKPEPGAATGGSGSGLLLRLQGDTATTRIYDPATGYGEPRTLTLQPAEVGRLAANLAREAPDDLPVNLWAPDYTDLSLRVLDHRRSLQARRFAGMEPHSHGEAQARFDRLVAALETLHANVLTDGEPYRP